MTFNNELRRVRNGTVVAGSGLLYRHLRGLWAPNLFFGGWGQGGGKDHNRYCGLVRGPHVSKSQ